MPIREDEGRPVEAFYSSHWVRLGKPGERPLPAIENSLGGWEDGDDLCYCLIVTIGLGVKHFRSKGIGEEGIQTVLDWAGLVNDRLKLGIEDYLVCDAPSRNRRLIPRYLSTDEWLKAKQACKATEFWYQGEHGNAQHHLTVVNGLTLSFRLI